MSVQTIDRLIWSTHVPPRRPKLPNNQDFAVYLTPSKSLPLGSFFHSRPKRPQTSEPNISKETDGGDMLSKPGEARNSGTTPSYRNRKVIAEESPDDIVRRLQRVPSNKACADCSSKVNIKKAIYIIRALSIVCLSHIYILLLIFLLPHRLSSFNISS